MCRLLVMGQDAIWIYSIEQAMHNCQGITISLPSINPLFPSSSARMHTHNVFVIKLRTETTVSPSPTEVL